MVRGTIPDRWRANCKEHSWNRVVDVLQSLVDLKTSLYIRVPLGVCLILFVKQNGIYFLRQFACSLHVSVIITGITINS